ncbi:peptide chain release factor N(5)-glutamine methyltransferase [Helicobacter sp. MIT 05-5294]|nr:peptide chain release factor N(5)-glutamine methyltransferase [Helicobacter sp. MIT 05-5294]
MESQSNFEAFNSLNNSLSWSVKEALEYGAESLRKSGIMRPVLESEILLSFVLKTTRVALHCHFDERIDSFWLESFKRLIKRRSLYEPIEYLTECVGFFGEELYISHGALIPRPETEILVQKALDLILSKDCKRIAEIGVGSGAISVLLAHLLQNTKREFHASDISPEALFNAYVNKVKFKANNLTLHHSSYLDFNQSLKIPFDLLLSNPPYIQKGEILPPSLKYEPQRALFGGKRGDEILLHIIQLSFESKIPFLVCEMGYNQRESVESYLQTLPHKKLEFYQDLAGLERGFLIEF